MKKLSSIVNLTDIDTSNVTDMSYMFRADDKLSKLDLSQFNTSKVINMSNMFSNCNLLTELDVSSFNTENVKDMSYMFFGCSILTELDVSNFKTSRADKLNSMFAGCSALTELDVSSFETYQATHMEGMFQNCNALNELDVSSFNTANVVNMDLMFSMTGSNNLRTIYATDSFVTTSVISSDNMFLDCNELVGGEGTQCDGATHIDDEYARIDHAKRTEDPVPGYFTEPRSSGTKTESNTNDTEFPQKSVLTQEPAIPNEKKSHRFAMVRQLLSSCLKGMI